MNPRPLAIHAIVQWPNIFAAGQNHAVPELAEWAPQLWSRLYRPSDPASGDQGGVVFQQTLSDFKEQQKRSWEELLEAAAARKASNAAEAHGLKA